MVDVSHLFPGADGVVYLNTATMALGNVRTAAAVNSALDEWQHGSFDWARAEAAGESLRAAVAALLGQDASTVALVTGASGAAGTVAAQLPPARAKQNVVVPTREFSSNFLPWRGLRNRGYELRLVDDVDGVLDADAFAAAVDNETTVVATSLVHSHSGFRVDVDALKSIATDADAWLVLDASQALGSFSVATDGIAALFSCSHKWLLGQRGIGYLYVNPSLIEPFEPITPGWKATEAPGSGFYGPNLDLADRASKLDASTPWFDAIANLEGLRIIEEVGIETIAAHNRSLVDRLEDGGIAIPFAEQQRSSILSLDVPNPEQTSANLASQNVVAAVRGGRLRISFHLYNTIDDADTVISSIE